MPDLAERIARIAQDPTLPQSVEEAARQTAVLPVLDALGWDCWDGNEVTPEFEVLGGRVDYCLQSGGRRLVLIEVKRTGTDLNSHEEQLLRYAFEGRAPVAALTDGRVWWLYLPRADAHWEQRRFCSVDFTTTNPEDAAASLQRFLGREASVSGRAFDEAEREFESQERVRQVEAALQDAWQHVLDDPEGLLRDLLAETVRDISGHLPDHETVRQFVLGKLRQEHGAAPAPPSPTRSRRRKPSEARPDKPLDQEPHSSEEVRRAQSRQKAPPTRVAGFVLDGARHEVTNWPDMLVRVCDLLVEQTGSGFAERVSSLQGRLRPWFSSSPEGYIRPRQLENGLFLETGLSAKDSRQRAHRILTAVRGTDEGIEIELASPETEPTAAMGTAASAGAQPARGTPDGIKGRRPAAFWLDGTRHEVRSWRELLPRVCQWLANDTRSAFIERITGPHGVSYLRSSVPDSADWVPIDRTGLYVYVNITGTVARDRAHLIVAAVRGSDDGFRIELAE